MATTPQTGLALRMDGSMSEEELTAILGAPRAPHQLNGPGATTTSGTDPRPADRLGWGIRQWERKDPKGLLALKAQHPDTYRQLFVDGYGTEPKGMGGKTLAASGPLDVATAARLNAPDRQTWSHRDWEMKDPQGLLMLEQHDPARKAALFDAQYRP